MGKVKEDRLERFRKHCPADASISISHVKLENGAELEDVVITPASVKYDLPVLFLPGLASVIETFSDVVYHLSEGHIVHYVETREKASAVLPPKAGFTVRDMAADIAGVIKAIEFEDGKYILVSYSLSATISIELFSSGLEKKPALLVLIQPATEFRMPWFTRPLARYFYPLFPVIKPLLKLYMRKSMVDTDKDHEMYMISSRSMDATHPRRVAKTLLAMQGYSVNEAAKKIDVHVLVIGASNDTFHCHDDAVDIAKLIEKSSHIDLVTNTRSHSREVCDLIHEYLKSDVIAS